MNSRRLLRLFWVVFLFLVAATPAQTSRAPGVDLFEQGKFPQAIVALEVSVKTDEFKSDGYTWNVLGLAYYAESQIKKSRKAFEKSVSLNPNSAVFRVNLGYAYLAGREIDKAQKESLRALKIDPKLSGAYEVLATSNMWEDKLDDAAKYAEFFIEYSPGDPQAYILKAHILEGQMAQRIAGNSSIRDELHFLKEAIDVMEIGMAKSKAHPMYSNLKDEQESLTVFYDHFSRDPLPPTPAGALPPPPSPGVTPYRIIYQPKASYTDQARANNVQGAVRIAILFGADGRIKYTLLLKRLGWGLDEEAMKAARAIKFEPKTKDGKPVSVVVIREYTFSIY
jgi:TonB family protein